MSNNTWKVWLRPNPLTAGDKDHVAAVLTVGRTLRNPDIARRIKDLGSELKIETIQYILDTSDRITREAVAAGNSVLTGCCQFTPRVQGNWIGANAKFNSAIHRIGAHIIPSAEMRMIFRDIRVEVLGVRPGGAFIALVTDTTTGHTDGTMTSGDDLLIEGDRIRILPEDEAGMGVFFVNADGEAIPVTRRLTMNQPKRLIARVPELPAGQYTLRIVTRFTNGNTLLKEPRVIEYDRPLVVN